MKLKFFRYLKIFENSDFSLRFKKKKKKKKKKSKAFERAKTHNNLIGSNEVNKILRQIYYSNIISFEKKKITVI